VAGRSWRRPTPLGALGGFRSVFLVPRDDQSHVDARLVFPFGERHNPHDEGLAHYLEHLAWANLAAAGTDGGHHSNALTTGAATAYWLSRGPDDLPDMVKRLVASASPLQVTESYALKERDIVRREHDLRVSDDPLRDTWADILGTSFSNGPFSRSVLGTRDSIAGFTLGKARDLHDRTHHVSEATLLVRGPVTPAQVRRAVDSLDGWPAARAPLLAQDLPMWPRFVPRHEKTVVIEGLGRARVLRHMTHDRPGGVPAPRLLAARNILVRLMNSTKTGSLARPLRYDDFLASSFQLSVDFAGRRGLQTWITAEPDQGIGPHALNAAIDGHLDPALRTPARDSFEAIRARELADIDGVLDPLEINARNLARALETGTDHVLLGDLRAATATLDFETFRKFTRHMRTPRTDVVRLVEPA
jgi:predicted Zn-dependent peptidase